MKGSNKVHRRWAIFFAFWLLLLTGSFSSILGTPGIIQSLRLKRLLEVKKTRISKLQQDILRLQIEAKELEKNPLAQIREIRRVLGYAAGDELIFDFNARDQI